MCNYVVLLSVSVWSVLLSNLNTLDTYPRSNPERPNI